MGMGKHASTTRKGTPTNSIWKTMRKAIISLMIVFIFGQLPAAAQNRNEDHPGYVDFSELDTVFGDEPVIEINIHGALLRLVAEASALDDPELADLLRRVRGVYVRGFELRREDLDGVRRYRDIMSSELERDHWDTFVRVRERNEDVNFYVRFLDDEIVGIVIISVDMLKDQSIFLNIVGNIDPEQIGRIGRKFGVNGMSGF